MTPRHGAARTDRDLLVALADREVREIHRAELLREAHAQCIHADRGIHRRVVVDPVGRRIDEQERAARLAEVRRRTDQRTGLEVRHVRVARQHHEVEDVDIAVDHGVCGLVLRRESA
jgi:hypothetical protein